MKKTANLCMGFDDRAKPVAEAVDSNGHRHKAFRALGDPAVRDIFKHHSDGPRTYEFWSMYFEVEDGQELRDIRNDLNAEFPGQLRTIGAWWWDGEQVMNPAGQQPLFPLHTTVLEYMPDVWNGDDPPTFSPATELTDVNLGFGQSPRQF